MTITMRIPGPVHRRLEAHLFGGGPSVDERCAFAYATIVERAGGTVVLVQDLLEVPTSGFAEVGPHGFELTAEMKLEAVLRARRTGRHLIEIHSHPHVTSDDATGFSRCDLQGQRELQRYLGWKHPLSWGALVFGRRCVDGVWWQVGDTTGRPLDAVVVDGRPLTLTPAGVPRVPAIEWERYQRQLLAFDAAGQGRLASVRVGFVGCGGLGFYLAQLGLLAGVRRLLLVDDDRISENNRNRLPGVGAADVGERKVTVLERALRTMASSASITCTPTSLREPDTLAELRFCDVIVAGVDNDGARAVLADLAAAYLIPLIDVASDVLPAGRVIIAGGRVHVWTPGTNCLWCDGLLDPKEVAAVLQTPNEREARRRLGYGGEARPASASVAHVNAHVASSAIQELHALVSGYRPVHRHRRHRADRGTEVVVQDHERPAYCACCVELLGVGDRVALDRYALPTVDTNASP